MRSLWVQAALALFQTDLALGQEVDKNPEFEKERSFLGGKVRVKKLLNYGAAGGGLSGHMDAVIRGGGILTLASAGLLVKSILRKGHTLQKMGYTLLTGGALSNLYERCRKGYVVDYVSFRTPFQRLNRLVFNPADFFIMAGAILICLRRPDHT